MSELCTFTPMQPATWMKRLRLDAPVALRGGSGDVIGVVESFAANNMVVVRRVGGGLDVISQTKLRVCDEAGT